MRRRALPQVGVPMAAIWFGHRASIGRLGVPGAVQAMARHHHERWDGGGDAAVAVARG
jgi:HD-GYP domain-containing protein (c-di-GMP phosphodiesterase class II)